MVIMENYYTQEKCRELCLHIDQLHLSYLAMEESPEKLQYRSKLEDCIAEFLCLTQHRDIFIFPDTEQVFYSSAKYKKDFSGYKATMGWNAIQIYAANLLSQPWRKEYRQIKTYCGFYKHQVEANLVGAETIFEAMGYTRVESGVMVLDGPICPDKVSSISRDCLVAYVECQILKHIWEEVTQNSEINLSWLEILKYRASYPGNVEHCIRNIKLKCDPKHCQPQPVRNLRTTEPFENRYSSQTSVSNNCATVANTYSAGLNNFNHMTLPVGMIVPPVPYCISHPNSLEYAYGTCSAPLPFVKPPMLHSNGYFYGNMPVPPPVYQVPTGKLIELDNHNNGYDVVDDGSLRKRKTRLNSNGVLESDRRLIDEDLTRNELGSGHDEKSNVEEDWGYVYRNLEKQGYTKDMGERGDVLLGTDKRKHIKEQKKVKATNLDDAMYSLGFHERPLKVTEALEHIDKKPEKISQPKERKHSQGSSYENVTTSEKGVKNVSNPTIKVTSKEIAKDAKEYVVSEMPTNSVAVKTISPLVDKWECKSCTYLNYLAKEICEMCSKSRHTVKEPPMEVGGPECSKCTLVNPRAATECKACGNNLKNSPTYI
ncbi:hypothetical protein ABEB36_007429 [Hypothenemus hampei]|uniref:RanBP2-type domain-containing protein n=1 Tax=Hypothenemus hampei TaxID=57062 RepID=A0ABD1ETY2_HYPHA